MKPAPATPKPFALDVPDAAIADLRRRLARTRWPDEPPLTPWSTGTSVTYMRELVAIVAPSYDWRARDAS